MSDDKKNSKSMELQELPTTSTAADVHSSAQLPVTPSTSESKAMIKNEAASSPKKSTDDAQSIDVIENADELAVGDQNARNPSSSSSTVSVDKTSRIEPVDVDESDDDQNADSASSSSFAVPVVKTFRIESDINERTENALNKYRQLTKECIYYTIFFGVIAIGLLLAVYYYWPEDQENN